MAEWMVVYLNKVNNSQYKINWRFIVLFWVDFRVSVAIFTQLCLAILQPTES